METEKTNATETDEKQDGTGVVDQSQAQTQTGAGETVDTEAQTANAQTQEQDLPLHLQKRHQEIVQKKEQELEAEKARSRQLEQNMLLMQQQILASQTIQSQQSQQQPKMSGYLARVGVEAGDIPTAEQVEKAMELQQQETQAISQARAFLDTHPDFNDVVGRINPATRQIEMSESLKKVITKKPALNGLQVMAFNNPAMALIAYELAANQKRIDELEGKTAATDAYAQLQAAKDKTSPMSAQAAGGGAAVNQEAQYENLDMSNPADIAKVRQLAAKMRAGQIST